MPSTIFNIQLTGNDDVDRQLAALGDAGEAAVARIKAAAEGATTAGAGSINAVKDAGAAVAQTAGAAGTAIAGTFAKIESAVGGGVLSGVQNLAGGSGLGGLLGVIKNINPEIATFAVGLAAMFAAGKSAAS